MTGYYWNDWYSGWGYLLWFGMIFLLFSTLGNWGYTYQAHSRYRDFETRKNAFDLDVYKRQDQRPLLNLGLRRIDCASLGSREKSANNMSRFPIQLRQFDASLMKCIAFGKR